MFASSSHPLANQEEIGVSDRLVIKLCLAASGRVSLKRRAEAAECFENRKFREIGEGEPYVIRMMEFASQVVGFESPDDFVICDD